MTRKAITLMLLMCAIFPGVTRAEHAVRWYQGTMIDLGTLGGDESWATGINDAGDVVGASGTGYGYRGFLWSGGTMTNLGTVGLASSYAWGINEAGHVVGYAFGLVYGGTAMRGFVWRDGVIDALSGGDTVGATDINNLDQIVGGDYYGAVMWDIGTRKKLGSLGKYSFANSINDLGQVVGADGSGHAFLWNKDTTADLGTLGGKTSDAYGINAFGHVVGESETAEGTVHAFLWRDGTMTDLGTLGGLTSTAYGINDAGEVVGESKTADGSDHAFIWRNGTLCDLGEGSARAINNRGEIVGSSSASPFSTPPDSCAAPTPSPSPVASPIPSPAASPSPSPTPSSAVEPEDWKTVKPSGPCTTSLCKKTFIKDLKLLKVKANIAIATRTAADIAWDKASRAKPNKKAAAEAKAAKKETKAKLARERFDQGVIRIQSLHD